MDFWSRHAAALAALEQSGLSRAEYAPPLYRLFWRLRVPVRPPHFQSFAAKFLTMSVFFGLVWGGIMAVYFKFAAELPPNFYLYPLVAGALFGLAMAWILHAGAKSRALPQWGKLATPTGTPGS